MGAARKYSCNPGERYGKLTVIAEVLPGKKGRRVILRCDCGALTKPLEPFRVGSGRTSSCGKGTCRGVRGSGSARWTGHGDIPGHYWANVRNSASRRGYKVSITIEEAWELFQKQDGRCALSGVPIKLGRWSEITASLDRIDSQTGYTLDNIQWVHSTVNRLKMDLPEEELLGWCQRIVAHLVGHKDDG